MIFVISMTLFCSPENGILIFPSQITENPICNKKAAVSSGLSKVMNKYLILFMQWDHLRYHLPDPFL